MSFSSSSKLCPNRDNHPGTTDTPRSPSPLHPIAQHNYTTGTPGPPRIFIPPHVVSSPVDVHSAAVFGPLAGPAYLNKPLAPGLEALLSAPSALLEWTYESRRQAQQVLPWVWLGSLTTIKDKDSLARRGITLLIAVRSSMTAKAKLMGGGRELNTSESVLKHPPGRIGTPAHVTLDLPSAPGAPLISTFRMAAQLIDRNYLSTVIPEQLDQLDNSSNIPDYHSLVEEHFSQYTHKPPPGSSLPVRDAFDPFPPGTTRPGSTLVFCETGNEKSAVVLASYIMQHYESSLVQAIQMVQGRRFSVGFDDSYKYALASWEPIYKSYRDVFKLQKQQQQSQVINGAAAGNSKKRAYEELISAEEDAEDRTVLSQVVNTVDGRSGIPPFRDDDDDYMEHS